MYAELVHDGALVHLPKPLGTPRDDQMQGSEPEKLMEVCGRTCYDSMGTGRPSGEYHRNLLFTQRHYSVPEHVHFTVETDLTPCVWVGVPDMSVVRLSKHRIQLTANLRHVLEWPEAAVTFVDMTGGDQEHLIRWKQLLGHVAHTLCPNVFTGPVWSVGSFDGEIISPELPHLTAGYMGDGRDLLDTQAFVSAFLEDSRVFSHEMVRHRGNISQRSGRFVDETDRSFTVHPILRDYLNEVGYLKNETPDLSDPEFSEKMEVVKDDERQAAEADHGPRRKKGTGDEPLWEGGSLSVEEAADRTRFGSMLGSYTAQGTMNYLAVVERLQSWLERKGTDKLTARKQARSAARYYLGNGLSTELVFTASIRHWRHIFKMRCSPHADAAIREVMEKTYEIVRGSRYGHLL